MASIPDTAPRHYQGADTSGDPLQFLRDTWGKYIEAGLMHQADLRHLDKRLYDAFHSYCQNRKISPSSILATGPRADLPQLTAEERLERLLKQRREASARYRAKLKGPTP